MKVEEIKIPSTDGKNIAAAVHYPENDINSLAILCPGKLDSKDYAHLVRLAEALSDKGYIVVRFDPIGTWGSDGLTSDYLVSQYIHDVGSVLEYMLQQKSYKEILIGEHSRGAAVSIFYAARDSRITKVLAIMPPSSVTEKDLLEQKFVEWKKTGFCLSVRDLPHGEGKREYDLPYAHLVDQMKFNVTEDVKKVNAQIIFVAGELDVVCTPENVREIFDASSDPKKYILIKRIGHSYRHNPKEIEYVDKEILKYL